MGDCECTGPGYCVKRGVEVSRLGYQICKSGNERSIDRYFAPEVKTPSSAPPPERRYGATQARSADAPCAYLGDFVHDASGRQVLTDCRTCRGTVKLKVRECHHPGHVGKPRTTEKDCGRCRDYSQVIQLPPGPNIAAHLRPMVAPSQKRAGIWRNGVIQIQVTRACDLACHHCTQGSNLAGKPVVMTPDQFDQACASLEGYWGVVGMFGGNPAMHPQFDKLCEIMRARFPFEQRGLWCNNLRGKGQHARITFNPRHSNLNVHLESDAAEEMRRDWPECAPHIKGVDIDSVHGSPWVALKDVIADEAERWKLIGKCDVNQHWSAAIGVVPGKGLRAFFCEIAYTQAALHADNPDWDGTGQPMPDLGLTVLPGWWKFNMNAFEAQAKLHCHACGIPMRRPGQLAIGGEKEEFSETHRHIARPKVRERPVEIVSIGNTIERVERPSTEYLPGTTPRFAKA